MLATRRFPLMLAIAIAIIAVFAGARMLFAQTAFTTCYSDGCVTVTSVGAQWLPGLENFSSTYSSYSSAQSLLQGIGYSHGGINVQTNSAGLITYLSCSNGTIAYLDNVGPATLPDGCGTGTLNDTCPNSTGSTGGNGGNGGSNQSGSSQLTETGGTAYACSTGFQLENGQCVWVGCATGYVCGLDGNQYLQDAQCNLSLAKQCSYGCGANACLPPPPPLLDLVAQPNIVKSGETSNVSWSAANVQLCKITSTNADQWSCSGTSCLATSTKQSSAITTQTIYTLNCTGLDNSLLSRSVTVNVVPSFNEH